MKKIFLLFTCISYFYNLSAQSALKYVKSESEAGKTVVNVLKASPVIDGHNDLFIHYFDCKTCPIDLKDYRIDTIAKGHTDIPRMRKGGVGAMLMNVFGRDTNITSYLQAWDLLYRMEAAHSKDLKVVGTSAEIRSAMKEGKIALLPILENALRLKNNPALLRTYYKLGLRSVTMAYSTNGLADGSDDTARHNGISAKGKEMVKEMNRLGMLVDISHISAKAMHDILDVTQAPVIFSHSNVKALTNVNRNVPDDVLLRLKQNRGIIMLTFVPYFTTNQFSKWTIEGDSLYYATIKKYPEDTTTLGKIMDQWENENPKPEVTVSQMADHFDYVKKLIGVDHIGMAGDYDGIYFTIKGLEDVSTFPKLLIELARRGWTEAELRKITGENFLRVFEQVEKKAEELKKRMTPVVKTIIKGTVEAKVDSFVETQMKENKIAGLSLAVMREGKIIYTKGYGFSNLEHQTPATENTVYLMGSITKPFVAIATMMLVEEGRINLEDRIGKYVTVVPDHWKPVTIRQILNHTSGIPSNLEMPPPCKFDFDPLNYSQEDVIKETACLPLAFTPGEKWQYSGRNYFLLGMLIEKVTGKKLEDFLQVKIFTPLGMTDTRMMNYNVLIPHRAAGYVVKDGVHLNHPPQDPVVEFADGGLISTVVDMAKWDAALYTEKLLKKETMELMFTPAKTKNGNSPYGIGFGLTPFAGKKRIGHTGNILGFVSAYSRFPNENISVVVFMNTQLEGVSNEIAHGVASFYLK
jgi:membrane dipeptidase